MNNEMNHDSCGRILIVDDTTANLKLLTNLLTEQGYTVHPASDGELALEFVRMILPDLILLDIKMPGIDGYEVCQRLKGDERTHGIPVIFISALEDERDKVQGFLAGGVDYITKPFQPEEVLVRIKTHLHLRELTERLEQKVDERTEELTLANQRLEREIVERKLAEEELHQAVGKLRQLDFILNHSPAVAFLWKAAEGWPVKYVSSNVRQFGYTPDDFCSGRLPFASVVHSDDLQRIGDEVAFFSSDPGCDQFAQEYRIVSPEGQIFTVDDRSWIQRNKQGEITHYQGIVLDITERKQAERAMQESEAKMRSIMDNIGIGVAMISPEMKILELNRRMHEWFPAVDPGQHPICYQAFNDPPRAAICDYCPTCKTLQDGLVHEATTQTPQPGGTRNYRVVSSPVLNPSGKVTAAIEMVEDITEKLSLENQLSQAQKMESVGRLAGGVAHDFNNMLGVIIGHTELALDQMDPTQPLFTPMQEILKAALRSAALTRQLLAFARKQTVVPKVLDLNETVEGMLKMLRRLIGEDIDLVWLPDSDLWTVKMDPSQIDQILANLCVNARDAIAGVGKITIETHSETFDEAYCANHAGFIAGDFVMLAVSDDGQGMDKETLDKIFEPFFTTKGVGQGTGLGLATVYGVVKQNNGFINVYSEPGQGSTFKIYLPRHAAKNGKMRKERPAAPNAQGHETVLLVEDEAAILRVTKLMLENLGYRVLTASTPGEAILLAKEHDGEIHLLVTDVVMPDMNGLDLAKKLISLYPGLRSLFMSGYTGNVIAHHGILGDGINFLQKPFSIQALAAKVREVLDSK
ncbi:MAG: response regulator [Proteobacteria bacterium]|nr:response regulator [Pseudomonadota bacterium]MBU4296215.1 response regulator [Pseudomonadota bacterium]MCG2746427.1 response regulator [Desulfobulbaceae bacterium]